MTASDSTEQTKQQEAVKEDGKKPVEVKDEDLVRHTVLSFSNQKFDRLFSSRKTINNWKKSWNYASNAWK